MSAAEPNVDPGHWRELDEPRVPALTEEEMNAVSRTLAKGAGKVVGGPPPNIFLTLGRNPKLFGAWLAFASQLMPRGGLPRRDTELVILRVAWNTRTRYEWDHHVRLGREAGLSVAEIERVAEGPGAEGWTDRQVALLNGADELHSEGTLSAAAYEALAAHLDQKLLIEFCFLVGHYEMLAMTISSLGIQPEKPLPPTS